MPLGKGVILRDGFSRVPCPECLGFIPDALTFGFDQVEWILLTHIVYGSEKRIGFC
jgi:hypothetical protein